MPRFRKIYLEISNICNLRCSFCPGTKRKPHIMDEQTFRIIAAKIRPFSDYLYFHLMGEPLCHPLLTRFLEIAEDFGFKVILTTNGTLLKQVTEILISAPALHKVNISLHAFEANDLKVSFVEYLHDCFQFGQNSAGRKLIVYRLWNNGGADSKNEYILKHMQSVFPPPWNIEPRGTRIADRTYLEYGDKFDWPDLSVSQQQHTLFCYGLRDQIGILCDGTVVPCCLDHEGDIELGNILDSDLDDILASCRARAIIDGFSQGFAAEELCSKCGYARKFRK